MAILMNDFGSSFSDRHGYHGDEREITIREDAPEEIRAGVLMLGYAGGMGPSGIRAAICEVLLKRPDPGNWSPGNVEGEVSRLIDQAPWYNVYDIAERLHGEIRKDDYSGIKQVEFERRLNQLFREHGVGWQMENGSIIARGSEAFTIASKEAVATMRDAGKVTAATEIHEALIDISRRPKADVTGAIQHAMAALECVAREIDSSKDTLGKIIPRLTLPAPLGGALHRLWGFASEQGRHIQEGREPRFEEAELVVTVASAVSVYLLRGAALAERR